MLHFSRMALLALLTLAPIASLAPAVQAASGAEIDADVNATLTKFFNRIDGSRALASKANGILVFPSVVKAGIGIGGEYGEGALRVGGRTVAYYSTVSASFGFQLGVQERSIVIMFMTPDALERFERSNGWQAGVDGSIAIVTLGVGGSIDTTKIRKPVIGFILDPKGLMYNLTLEGSKITRIDR
jgi:lipid-binding SYLF domain-containing protein